jgi:hypothetical protein
MDLKFVVFQVLIEIKNTVHEHYTADFYVIRILISKSIMSIFGYSTKPLVKHASHNFLYKNAYVNVRLLERGVGRTQQKRIYNIFESTKNEN